jgi:hypothetical protein
MGDDYGCPACQEPVYGTLDEPFGLGVYGTRRFIEDHDPGVCDQGPGKAYELFLPGTQEYSPFAGGELK